jgi:hypothetical protein
MMSIVDEAKFRTPSPERITVCPCDTVALIPKGAEELQRLQRRSGLSTTDLVNRAITLYDFIDDKMREDREVRIRESRTGNTERVRFW